MYTYNSSTYTICLHGHAVVKEYAPEEFDSVSRQPQDGRVETYEDKIVCPNDLFGIFPYPFSKEKYFKCIYGDLYIKQCRPGTVYNISTKLCEYTRSHDKPDFIYNLSKLTVKNTFYVAI